MKKLLSILMLLVAIVTGASAADVITFAGATTKDSKTTALTPTISSSNSNITLGTCASTCSTEGYIVTTTDGKTTVLGTTTYYLSQPYQGNSKKYWKDAGASFYGTFTIPSGYTYVMKGINHALVANGSSNFTATISVKDATTTKYATSTISVAKKDDGATITSTTISLEEANWVTLSAGTYTINVVPSNTKDSSSGKYFGIAQVSITGDLAVAGPSLSVTPTTANAFTYVVGNGPSTAQKFTVSLANSEKAVSATLSSTNYEMSETEDGTYANTDITGLANGSKVYVRLKAGLEKADDYNGTLTFANDDVTNDVVVNLSGSVTGQTYTVEYDLNGGSGTAPQDQQEAGAKFNLAAAPTKDFTTFAGWLCDVDGQTYDAGAEYTMTAEPTTFTAQWSAPTYSSTLDFAANSVEQPDIATLLASGNMISDVTGAWEALTAGKEGYGGFKVKKDNASLKFLAQAGKHVTITLGTVASNVTLKKNGTTAGTISGGNNYTGNTKMSVVAFDAGEEDVLVELVTSSNSTVTLIKIAIEDALASTPVTVGETGFATIGLPYATTIPENVTAYSVSATSGTAVTLSSAIAAGTTIPANKGFIIVANPGNYTFNQFANDTWQGDVANKLEATGASAKVAAAAGEFYYFAIINADKKKVGFKKCAANANLAANKAYLPGALVPSGSNSLEISFDGETAINGIAESEANAEAPVKVVKNGQLFIGNYNVAGARIK